MELCLPDEKLHRVKAVVTEWLGREVGRKREMESMVGLLQHAAKVVHPGRRFVRRIIILMTSVQEWDHFIRLNIEICSDLQWWHKFMEQWNRIGLLPNPKRELITLETNASDNWGCWAVWDSHWLQWE